MLPGCSGPMPIRAWSSSSAIRLSPSQIRTCGFPAYGYSAFMISIATPCWSRNVFPDSLPAVAIRPGRRILPHSLSRPVSSSGPEKRRKESVGANLPVFFEGNALPEWLRHSMTSAK